MANQEDIILPDGTVTHDRRLDRVREFDEQSRAYPIRALIAATLPPRSYTWSCNTYLDQGSEGACVGFSMGHEILARPKPLTATEIQARAIYKRAQLIDPWPGENYEGTSVLAGIKILEEDNYIDEYRWAFGIDDLIMALGYKGPAILGVNWYAGQSNIDPAGFIHPEGQLLGGHAILANGIKCIWPYGLVKTLANLDRARSYVRLHNSWGRNWGINGDCFISLAELGYLLSSEQWGEAVIPVLRTAP